MRLHELFESEEKVVIPYVNLDYDSIIAIHHNVKQPGVKTKISSSKLIATERYVDYNPINKSTYKPFPTMTDLPVVLKYGKSYFILDGHHRLNKLIKDKKPSVDVYVVELTTDKGLSDYTKTVLSKH